MSVTHLILEQSDQVTENISNETSLDTTDKLAQVSRGVNNISDIQGKINVRAIYEDTLTYLTEQKWPNKLFITTGRQYIRFADNNVRSTLLTNNIGDGTQAWHGVTPSVAHDAVIGQIFVGNTNITTFDEFNRFVSANTNGNYSFYGCTNLRSINLSNCAVLPVKRSISNKNRGVFEECSSLISINNLGTITKIPSQCFKKCTSLTSINIPQTCTVIEACAFQNNGNLNITQNNLQSVEVLGCENNIDNDGDYINADRNSGVFGGDNEVRAIYSSSTLNLPNLRVLSSTSFFYQTNIQTIYLPNLEWLSGIRVFQKCSGITNAIIGVKDNGDGTYTHSQLKLTKGTDYNTGGLFRECTNLRSVQISNNITVLSLHMFYKCSNLEQIDIDFTNITKIYGCVFDQCHKIGYSIGSKIMNFANCTEIVTVNGVGHDIEDYTTSPFVNKAGLHIYLPKITRILPGRHNQNYNLNSGFISQSFIHHDSSNISGNEFQVDVLYLRDIQDIGRGSFYRHNNTNRNNDGSDSSDTNNINGYGYTDMHIKVLIIDNTTIPTMTAYSSVSETDIITNALNARSPFFNFNIGRIYVPDSVLSSYQNSSLFAGRSFVTNHDNSTDISTILSSVDTAILPLSQYVTDSVLTAEDKAIIASHSHNLL